MCGCCKAKGTVPKLLGSRGTRRTATCNNRTAHVSNPPSWTETLRERLYENEKEEKWFTVYSLGILIILFIYFNRRTIKLTALNTHIFPCLSVLTEGIPLSFLSPSASIRVPCPPSLFRAPSFYIVSQLCSA